MAQESSARMPAEDPSQGPGFLLYYTFPAGPARHLKMLRDKHCPLTARGGHFEREETKASLQPAPKYHTKGCSHSSAASPGARTLVFAAFEPFHSCEFRASIARTPFCAILWRSPISCGGDNFETSRCLAGPSGLAFFKARLGEPSLGKSILEAPKPALDRAKLALEHPNRHLRWMRMKR